MFPATSEFIFNKSVTVDVSAEQGARGVCVLNGQSSDISVQPNGQGGLITFNSDLTVSANSSGKNARGIALDNDFLDGTHPTTSLGDPGSGAFLIVKGNLSSNAVAKINAAAIDLNDNAGLTAGSLTFLPCLKQPVLTVSMLTAVPEMSTPAAVK